ncbi:MAG: M23 family metallopeptidase [Terricaulis sp.]
MRSLFVATILATLPASACAQTQALSGEAPAPIETVTLHRLFNEYYACGEHIEGELQYLGDALGADCLIQGGLDPNTEGGFARAFRNDGLRNEDWYGWDAEVLAPFDATIIRININPAVNEPGHLGTPPASFIVFERVDGMRVLFAHVQDILVEQGSTVAAGQVVAHVGNNGYGRNPHIHVGAWKDETPYQIRWDLRR